MTLKAAKISPNPDNYMVGKGVVSIGEYTGGTPTYFDVGNCPRFEYEPTEETLEHFSSRAGAKNLDKETTIQTGYTLNFTLDEISVKNMRMFLRASQTGTKKLSAMRELTKHYAVKFVSENAEGPDHIHEFWKVKLSPNGAFSLISDDYSTLSFSGKGMADADNHPTSPLFDVTFVTTTTTTTTTAA